MKGEQAPGLARLFKIIEQEAFCAGAKIGRASSYAADPEDLYHQYVDDAQGRAPTSPTAPIAEAPPEIEPAAIEDTPEVL